jgi:hypothetical protein
MNFPDVPFDENLFASNSMLKSYWERSTNERSGANIPDWPSEEKYDDLRFQTLEHFEDDSKVEAVETVEPEPEVPEIFIAKEVPEVEPVAEVINVKEPAKDGIVKPKALSTSGILAIVFASLALAMLIIYWFLIKFRSSTRY